MRRSSVPSIPSTPSVSPVAASSRVPRLVRDLLQDVRYAARLLIKAPGFTAVAVLSVALGIGANSAVFSFVDAILLRPLDVPRPHDVVRITTTTPAQRFSNLSFLELQAIRDRNSTLSGLAAEWRTEVAIRADAAGQHQGLSQGQGQGLSKGQDVTRVTLGGLVNRDYFTTLGMTPALGRTFLAEEDSPAARDIAAIVSHRAWQTRFDGDPNIIGRQIAVNGQPAVIVGVTPAAFTGTDLYQRQELFLPLAMAPRIRPGTRLLEDPADRGLIVRGRLKPGVSVAAAAADAQAIARALEQSHPASNRQRTMSILSDLDQRLETMAQDRRMSTVLFAIVLLVLIIAAVNVANLLLGRAAVRAKEIAIRVSVGASRWRLVRQLLTESLLLALLGGVGGLILAQWAIWSLRAITLPTDLPIVIDVRLDHRVALYGAALALITGIVFGVAPALQATRRDLIAAVKGSGGGSAGRRAFRGFGGRYTLVAAQAALCTLLLICAGLFVKSFHRVAGESPGYRVDGVLLASFSPALVNMPKADIETFYQQIQDRVRALPGVASVTLAKHVNLGPEAYSRRIKVDGQQYPSTRPWDTFDNNYVDAGYFETMGTPIVRGRAIDARDDSRAPKVAVVNETMATRFWPGRDAVGQRFTLVGDRPESVEVIGVARNAKYFNAVEPPALSYFYLPYRQHRQDTMTLHVRASNGDALALLPAVRREVQALAPDLPMFDVRRMRDVFEGKGLLAARLMAQMVGVIALIGATLALVGLYAVIAFVVTHRTREIGIRMALGATRASVARMTLGWGLKAAGAGIIVGAALALSLSNLLGTMIGSVSPHDPLVFTVVLSALLAAVVASSWLPARRAAAIAPTVALRQE